MLILYKIFYLTVKDMAKMSWNTVFAIDKIKTEVLHKNPEQFD